MHAFSVSDRISVSGYVGTIRYIGPIHVWSDDVTAYGIEWDDAERGKNNGDINDIRYFTTKIPNTGSFIKVSNKSIDHTFSFFQGLANRYLSEANTEALSQQVRFGSKTVENYGFQKLNQISSHVESLHVIMLDHQSISCAGTPKDLSLIGDLLKNPVFGAHTLDLSCTLLTKWADVSEIVRFFPKLKSLNLNGNRMESSSVDLSVFPETVTHLSLSASLISPSTLLHLNLDGVERLKISGNAYNETLLDEWKPSPHLSALDLSFNKFASIPPTLNTESLVDLILADNCIESLANLPVFEHVRKLDLRRNRINIFSEIDSIADVFPKLTDLRINGCPLFENMSAEETAMSLIGRLQCEAYNPSKNQFISKLNGSHLSESEVINAELFFISKVRSGQWTISNRERWKKLLRKHDISEISANLTTPVELIDHKIKLSIRRSAEPDMEIISRVFLQKNTVLRLKGIISKHIQEHVLDFSVYYYVNDDESYETRSFLQDDIASLQSLGLVQNHRIYIQ